MTLVEKIAENKDRLLTPKDIVRVLKENGFLWGDTEQETKEAILEGSYYTPVAKAQDAKTTQAILADPSIIEVDTEAVFPEMAEWGTDKQKIQKDYAEKMYDENWRRVKPKE